jgi:hypothetical protein
MYLTLSNHKYSKKIHMQSVIKCPFHFRVLVFSLSVCGDPWKGICAPLCYTIQDQFLFRMLGRVPKLFLQRKQCELLSCLCACMCAHVKERVRGKIRQ